MRNPETMKRHFAIRRAAALGGAAVGASAALLAMLALASCAPAPGGRRIVGESVIRAALPPAESRRLADEEARRDACAQMLAIVRQEAGGSGRTVGQMMDASPYVASRVRRAIEQSRIEEAQFFDDGRARVVMEMRLADIVGAAISAEGELP